MSESSDCLLLRANQTLKKNYPQPNFDSRLLCMKQSFKRLEKRCREGLKTARKRHSRPKESRHGSGSKTDWRKALSCLTPHPPQPSSGRAKQPLGQSDLAASRYHKEATANISSSSTGKSPSAPRMPGWSGRAGDFHGPGRFPKLSLRLLPC